MYSQIRKKIFCYTKVRLFSQELHSEVKSNAFILKRKLNFENRRLIIERPVWHSSYSRK